MRCRWQPASRRRQQRQVPRWGGAACMAICAAAAWGCRAGWLAGGFIADMVMPPPLCMAPAAALPPAPTATLSTPAGPPAAPKAAEKKPTPQAGSGGKKAAAVKKVGGQPGAGLEGGPHRAPNSGWLLPLSVAAGG